MTDAFDRAVDRTPSRRRSAARAGFRIHLASYVLTQLLLVGIWLFSTDPPGSASPWFVYPLLGWGIGVAAHWWAVRHTRRTT